MPTVLPRINFPRKQPLKIEKKITLHASPTRSFLYIAEHLNRCGLKLKRFDLLSMQATFHKREGLLKPRFHLTLKPISQTKGVLIIRVSRPFLSSLLMERRWYCDALDDFSGLVHDAIFD